MKNRTTGILIIGIAILIGFIVFSFNKALTNIVNSACSHGPSCPMWDAIDFQTSVSTGIMFFVGAIGVYLILFGKEGEIVQDKSSLANRNYQEIMETLNSDERTVLERVIEAEGVIFQSDLVDKTQFTKAKVTRILDRLEGKNLIERRRHGMSNVVVLKH